MALEMMTITINLLFMCKNIISLKNINGNSTKSLFIFNSLILPNKFVNGYRLCYINRFFYISDRQKYDWNFKKDSKILIKVSKYIA